MNVAHDLAIYLITIDYDVRISSDVPPDPRSSYVSSDGECISYAPLLILLLRPSWVQTLDLPLVPHI